MADLKSAALFIAIGFVLASLSGSLWAAPDKGLGMSLLGAAVDSGGNLVSGAGVLSAERVSTGDYNVQFKRSLEGCNHVAGVGGVNTISLTPRRGIHSRTNESNEVRVVTYETTTNSLFDTGFQVIVFCPK